MKDKVQGEIVLTMVVEREGGHYASFCVELGTTSCGDTAQEALDNIHEAVLVHLDALDDVNERERTLREKGIELLPPTIEEITPQQTSVRIPLHA